MASDVAKGASRVLLIDDDEELCGLLEEFFTDQGFILDSVHDARQGLTRARGPVRPPAPRRDDSGAGGVRSPATGQAAEPDAGDHADARGAKTDRLSGLDAGADDYVLKPFDPDELVSRARAVLRRANPEPRVGEAVEADGVRLAPTAREVWCEGMPVSVTTIEFDILEILVRSAGRVVTREELTTALYRRKASPFDRAIDVHVSRLRKKLGRSGERIATVRGVGYLYRSSPADEEDG